MTDEAILDAARSTILDFGVRRATLMEISRRAGVSRMTVYRRYSSVDAVLRTLMTREFGALIERVRGEHHAFATARERMVAEVVAIARALREHALMRKVMDAEPELLLAYVLGRMGGTQRAAFAGTREDIAAGQADGSIRPGDPDVLAQAVLLCVQSFVLSGRISDDVDEAALWAELPDLLDRMLRP